MTQLIDENVEMLPALGEIELDTIYQPQRRRCLNPMCIGGNVILPVSGRRAVCASCDGAGNFGSAREARERYYRGRNTALTLALQSSGVIDADGRGDTLAAW